ncbi:hypothetical protein SAMN05660297_03638, partial [Natronincola peptidivorans]
LLTTIMGDSMHAISRLPYPFIGFLARPDVPVASPWLGKLDCHSGTAVYVSVRTVV